MNRPPSDLAKKFLRAWLRLAKPSAGVLCGVSYSFGDLPEIPEGSYAVVSVKVAPTWEAEKAPSHVPPVPERAG